MLIHLYSARAEWLQQIPYDLQIVSRNIYY